RLQPALDLALRVRGAGLALRRGFLALAVLVGRDVADRMALYELRLEDALEHLAVHVLRDRQTQVTQQRRRDVEHRGVRELGSAASCCGKRAGSNISSR